MIALKIFGVVAGWILCVGLSYKIVQLFSDDRSKEQKNVFGKNKKS